MSRHGRRSVPVQVQVYMELAGALRPLLSPKEQRVGHAASPWAFPRVPDKLHPHRPESLGEQVARLWRHEERMKEKKNNQKCIK